MAAPDSAWCSEAYAALGDFPQAFASARQALRVATDMPSSCSASASEAWRILRRQPRDRLEHSPRGGITTNRDGERLPRGRLS